MSTPLLSPLLPVSSLKPLTDEEQAALANYHLGLFHTGITPGSPISSPTSSYTALGLEDEEIKQLFAPDKPNCTILATPTPTSVPSPPWPSVGVLPSYTSLPLDKLNPHAAPFISATTHSLRLFTSTPSTPTPKSRLLLRPPPSPLLPRRISKWLRTFTASTLAPLGNTDISTLIIVSSSPWTTHAEMLELAQEFCWRAVEVPRPEDVEACLDFAEVLDGQFRKMRSKEVQEELRWCLREVCVGAFVSVWDAKTNPEALSYTYTPQQHYVDAALRMGTIIGELHARSGGGIVPANDIATALETLMNNFISTEHLDAVDLLVSAAGPGFWFTVDVDADKDTNNNMNADADMGHRTTTTTRDRIRYAGEFIGALEKVGGRLGGEMSVLGKERTEGEVRRVVGEVVARVRGWREGLVELAAREEVHVQVLQQRQQQQQQQQQQHQQQQQQQHQHQQHQQRMMGMGAPYQGIGVNMPPPPMPYQGLAGGAPPMPYHGMQVGASFTPGFDQRFAHHGHAPVMGQAYC
ncbi:hypothetical protein Hypma_014288 [Hypsizygus marmoreus]|uniref:Uncharacterized protein n=1 Tax=Hypsizygus marmoreus TaxID=39966 RepID=A0A369JAC8_HYPMA|nr:hypothetical protein Hypma_014288 [Hypsizygus marmoreus]